MRELLLAILGSLLAAGAMVWAVVVVFTFLVVEPARGLMEIFNLGHWPKQRGRDGKG